MEQAYDPESNRNDETEAPFSEDLYLARAVCAGCPKSWQRFLKTYCGLIYSVVRRSLFAADEDEVRTIYVDVLQYLYEGNLEKYDGRGPLASWLITVTRCHAADFIRKQKGRYRPPKHIECLSELDQEVLRLYYAERLSLAIVIHTLKWNGFTLEAQDLVDSLQRIEARVDNRYLERLEMQCRLRTSDATSVEALKYLVRLRHDYEDRVNNNSIDQELMEKEAEETAERVWLLISKLPREDREVIELRFKRRKSAQEISEIMNLADRRKAYTLIARAVRRIKALMNNGGGTARADMKGGGGGFPFDG